VSMFHWIAVAIVTVLASARLTRLSVYDDFPPVKWLRGKYLDATDGSDWSLLALCGYCFSFWATLTVVLSGYFSDYHVAWWLVCASLAASYLAAMVVANDGDKPEGGA
jgi:hypothetical protein